MPSLPNGQRWLRSASGGSRPERLMPGLPHRPHSAPREDGGGDQRPTPSRDDCEKLRELVPLKGLEPPTPSLRMTWAGD